MSDHNPEASTQTGNIGMDGEPADRHIIRCDNETCGWWTVIERVVDYVPRKGWGIERLSHDELAVRVDAAWRIHEERIVDRTTVPILLMSPEMSQILDDLDAYDGEYGVGAEAGEWVAEMRRLRGEVRP